MSHKYRLAVLWLVFVVLTALLLVTGNPLLTDAAPLGIVSFQLAGDVAHASAILQSWGASGKHAAYLNLYLDFPYLVVYSWILSLLCSARAETARPPGAVIGRVLSRGAWFAGFFDAAENIALLHELERGVTASAAQFAWAAASVKFAILGIVVIYLVTSGIKAALD